MLEVRTCKACGVEKLSTRIRGGYCTATKSCRRTTVESRPPWMVAFFALPSETQVSLAAQADAEMSAFLAAARAQDDDDCSPLPKYRTLCDLVEAATA